MVFKRQSLPDIPPEFVGKKVVEEEKELAKPKEEAENIPSASEAISESESIGALIKQVKFS